MLLFFTFLSLIIFADSARAAQNIIIEIPEVIYAAKSSFPLSSVARITGGNSKTRKILGGLTLFSDGGTLSRQEVLRAINESDASDARIELYMPAYSRIESPAYEGNFTETPPEKISRSVQDLVPLIKNLSAWNGGLEISANAPVPDGKLIDPPSITPGTGTVNLRFRDSDGKVKSLPVRLTWTQNAMIAAHNIKKGDKIRPQDLISRPMKITRPGVYASNPNEIAGFVAEKNFKQGEPVTLKNLTSSNVIKRGRQVKIIARYGPASASVDGILLEDARPGEWVRVRRVDDRRVTLQARVINENQVEVQVE